MNNADQWLGEGDCNKCRRAKFCSKMCTAHVRRARYEFAGMLQSVLVQTFINAERKRRDDKKVREDTCQSSVDIKEEETLL